MYQKYTYPSCINIFNQLNSRFGTCDANSKYGRKFAA